MTAELLLREFHRVAQVRGAGGLLRSAIVQLALRGDLTADARNRGGLVSLSSAEIGSGMAALLVGRPRYRWKASRTARDSVPAKVPDGWTRASLNDTGLFINGLAFKPTDWDREGKPIIRIQNLSGKNPHYNFTRREASEDNIVRAGDLLVSWSATLDTYVWRGEDGVLNQHIFKVVPNSRAVTKEFLFWLLKHEVRQLARSQHAHGLAMMHINRGPFLAHEVFLPPLDEQREIVAKVDKLLALCDDLDFAETEREERRHDLWVASLRTLVESADRKDGALLFVQNTERMITKPGHVGALRHAILDLAVRGRLVAQDPDDEPAVGVLRRVGAPIRPTGTEEATAAYDLPDGWEWTSFGSLIATSGAGWSPKTENFPRRDDQWGVLKVSAVSWDSYRPEENKQLLPGVVPRPEFQVHEGDFLISRANTSELVAKAVLVKETPPNLMLSDKTVRLRLIQECSPEYLLIVNNHAPYARAYYAREASGASASMKNVSRQVIYGLAVPLPPLAEQHRIVAKVDQLMALCDALQETVTTEQTARSRLLDALLRDALGDKSPA